MKKREIKYHILKKACKSIGKCPEFPHFGARYPDATCIDGLLYDLDSYDSDYGGLTSGGDIPCPFCNTKAYIRHYDEDSVIDISKGIIKFKKEHLLKYPNKMT